MKRLLSEERRRWEDPAKIVLRLGLRRGHSFLDVGSGPGFFALEAARIVGQEGHVVCVDSDPAAANMCSENLARAGFSNFSVLASRIEDVELSPTSFDVALVADVLHDFEDPLKVLRKVFHTLRIGGVLGVVDWKKRETAFGPPLEIRLSYQECVGLLVGAGFRVVEKDDSLPYHYLVVAKKPSD